jgi:hypothetical protein
MRRLLRWERSGLGALLAAGLAVVVPGPALAALSVNLSATPSSGVVAGSPVDLLARVTSPLPNNTASVMFKFTIGREPGGERADGREFGGLATWRWTPAASGSYLLVVAVEARDVANRVLDTGSASIRGYGVGMHTRVRPGGARHLLANPYTLDVHPPSFADSTSSQYHSGGPLGGGMTSGVQRRQGTQETQGTPRATPATLIKLEARLRPGQTELPGHERRCVFEAVGADGVVRFTRENHCEAVETKLPADTYTLRLGFGFTDGPGRIFRSAEVPGYIVDPAFAQVLPPATGPSCPSPCTVTGGVCAWPSVGGSSSGFSYSCSVDQDCQSGFICVGGACTQGTQRCVLGPSCPGTCEAVASICTEKPSIFRVNKFCAGNADCDWGGYYCISGECRRPCR